MAEPSTPVVDTETPVVAATNKAEVEEVLAHQSEYATAKKTLTSLGLVFSALLFVILLIILDQNHDSNTALAVGGAALLVAVFACVLGISGRRQDQWNPMSTISCMVLLLLGGVGAVMTLPALVAMKSKKAADKFQNGLYLAAKWGGIGIAAAVVGIILVAIFGVSAVFIFAGVAKALTG
jgi:hypothetical protein